MNEFLLLWVDTSHSRMTANGHFRDLSDRRLPVNNDRLRPRSIRLHAAAGYERPAEFIAQVAGFTCDIEQTDASECDTI